MSRFQKLLHDSLQPRVDMLSLLDDTVVDLLKNLKLRLEQVESQRPSCASEVAKKARLPRRKVERPRD